MLTAIQQKKASNISLAVSRGNLIEAKKIYDEIKGRVSEDEIKQYLVTNGVPLTFLDESVKQNDIKLDKKKSPDTPDELIRGNSGLTISVPRYNVEKKVEHKKVRYQPISATIENWAKFEALATALGISRDSKQVFLKDILDSMINGLTDIERAVYEREYSNRIEKKERL